MTERICFLERAAAAELARHIAACTHKAVDLNGEPARLTHGLPGIDPIEYSCRVIGAYTGTKIGILDPPR